MAALNDPALGGLARHGLAGLAGAGVSAATQLLTVVLLTRSTTQETAGTFFTATALCLMTAGILRLDAGNGLVHFLARTRRDGSGLATAYLRAALVPVLLLSAAVATATVIIIVAAAGGTVPPGEVVPAGAPGAVLVAALALPAIVCFDVLVAATRGLRTMRLTALLDGLLRPLGQLTLIALVLPVLPGEPGVPGLALLLAAWALPYPPAVLLAALWLRRRLPRAPRSRDAARELWRHTWPRSAAAAVQAVFQRFDIVIVAALAGPVEAAVYTAATRFKVVGQLAGQGLAQAAQPRLVRALAEGDLPRARRLYQTTTAWLTLLTWPIWLAYAALAPWLLGLFGENGAYVSGVPVALVLAATMMIATACGMADVALTAAGHTRTSLVNLLTALAVTVALDVALIPALGALGAALGWSAGVLTKNLLPLWRLHRHYGLRPFGPHTLPACTPWRERTGTPALASRRCR
ncbi:hypothetical protein GCM10010156_56130 [Planobispora rosea]|uniref:Polysaccharide biosynthesis protein n=1 Tax=Planobispora rosea TaxID=35762 RepID=A0A8J3WF56_PLARO|nr:lipopolysaccharide biosynthesis protein [Planobispora rosea]GGS90540.1 hypothetical protein GCM10010156_56130 [Planobispora rosea]GIH86988.1 hypothetical protein Pro02_53960 [Planobispora rosea]